MIALRQSMRKFVYKRRQTAPGLPPSYLMSSWCNYGVLRPAVHITICEKNTEAIDMSM